MKFIYSIVLSTCLFLVNFAQAPQGLNYQGVARNNVGVELPNQNIGIQLSILDGAATGTVLYTETHALLTDANGLFTLVIGFGTPTTGTFSAVNWAVGGSKWLKVSMDAAGGSNYQLMGTSQLLSVPYALFAGNVANNGGKQTLVLSDNVTDSQAAAIIAAEVGPNTQEIRIVGTTNLTTVNLSMITTAISIVVTDNSALTTLNLGTLTRCDGELTIRNCPSLNNLNLSALTKVTTIGLRIDNTGLISINLNSLTKCLGSLVIGDNLNLTAVNLSALSSINAYLLLSSNSQLTSISLPNLSSCSNIEISNNTLLSNLNFPILNSCATIYIGNCTLLNNFYFPILTSIEGSIIFNTSINSNPFPTLSSITGNSFPYSQNFFLESNKLSVSAVNSILANLVSISPALAGKYIFLNNQTPLAPPSGQGIIDKATLITNGNTVTTD